MSRCHRLFVVVTVCSLLMIEVGQNRLLADLVINGSFEEPVISTGTFQLLSTGSSIGAWTVLGTPGNNQAVGIIHTNYAEPANGVSRFIAQHGLNALDLTGSSNQGLASGVAQTIVTDPGQLYRITFHVGRASGGSLYSTPARLNLAIDGAGNTAFTNSNSTANSVNWQLFTHDFVATNATTTLSFFNGQTTNNFTGLDNVSVSAVPEPSTLLLVGSAAAVFLIGKRNRRRSSVLPS